MYNKDFLQILDNLVENKDQINLCNYRDLIKDTVSSIKILMECYNIPDPEIKSDLEMLSELFHDFLYDIYEESLRNEENWNRYFNNLVSEISVLEIDVEKVGENEKEQNEISVS